MGDMWEGERGEVDVPWYFDSLVEIPDEETGEKDVAEVVPSRKERHHGRYERDEEREVRP